MSRRQRICADILRKLAEWETPVNDAVIHAEVAAHYHPRLLLAEFQDALEHCEREKWVTGIRTGLNGVRWSITDTGRAELAR